MSKEKSRTTGARSGQLPARFYPEVAGKGKPAEPGPGDLLYDSGPDECHQGLPGGRQIRSGVLQSICIGNIPGGS